VTRFARIAATGRYVPARRVTNEELEQQLGEKGAGVDAWLRKNVGIEARHYMADGEVTSDLACAAGNEALRRASVAAAQLGMVILSTDTPDQQSPATATRLQVLLGAVNAAAFDLNSACAGFVTALDLGARYLASDPSMEHVLVIGAYGMSRFLDKTEKQTSTLFADGAGAVLLSASERPGFLGARLATDGRYWDALGIYTGGTARPATLAEVEKGGPPTVRFVKKFPSTFNTERWPALIRQVTEQAGLAVSDVALFVFTQLNLRTIEATMAVLEQPLSKTHWTMDKWGYTGSGCIPMTLDDAVALGKVKAGDHVILCATGGGLSLACALFRWG
jgi:3-oxoacyl-[acyl-carrier-protein] synthase III